MRAWVAERNVNYEGATVLGVAETRAGAEALAEGCMVGHWDSSFPSVALWSRAELVEAWCKDWEDGEWHQTFPRAAAPTAKGSQDG